MMILAIVVLVAMGQSNEASSGWEGKIDSAHRRNQSRKGEDESDDSSINTQDLLNEDYLIESPRRCSCCVVQ